MGVDGEGGRQKFFDRGQRGVCRRERLATGQLGNRGAAQNKAGELPQQLQPPAQTRA
jgi:hypothetical protein